MEKDARSLSRNVILAKFMGLSSIRIVPPCRIWHHHGILHLGLDLIRPIHPLARGNIWILMATEYVTKWVEAIPMKMATWPTVSNLLREHICCFGIPYKIIIDNGTPFVNKHVNATLGHYNIKHRRSTPYYPQGNDQAETTNKVISKILSKMVHEYKANWSARLINALWAYKTSPRESTGFSPYSFISGAEVIIPIELSLPTIWVIAVNAEAEKSSEVHVEC